MKKFYNAPMTESQEVMAQMIMQTQSPFNPTNTGAPIDDTTGTDWVG
jgi:hypothetical protein